MQKITVPVAEVVEYKRAASGAGVVVFQMLGERMMRILLSVRTKDVGPGLGITGGGFVEVNTIDCMSVGTIVETADEAYREACEENAGFEQLISVYEFLERAQPVSTALVRTGDQNRVHDVTMYALRVKSDEEWDTLAALEPGTDANGKLEREGSLLECILTWTADISRRVPQHAVSFSFSDGSTIDLDSFFHQHEVHGIATIAWHAEKGRLWL